MNKQSLIEYYKIIYPTEARNDISLELFDELFLKATGKPYSNYLKKLEKIKEKEERVEYEKIP